MVELVETLTGFPVVLYDGERHITFDNIHLNPMLDFKQFRTILSENVGISYNNLTTYFYGIFNSNKAERRKILITNKVDFSTLVDSMEEGYFLVVLKRSRRERRKKSNKQKDVEYDYLPPMDLFDFRYGNHREIVPRMHESDKAEIWLQEMQKANINMVQNSNYYMDENFPSVVEAYPTIDKSLYRPLCVDCTRANRRGLNAEFHLCKYDEVLLGFFRSKWGPIGSIPKSKEI